MRQTRRIGSQTIAFFTFDGVGRSIVVLCTCTIRRLIRVREVMVAAAGEAVAKNGPTVSPDDDLRRVASLFLEHGVDELACADPDGRVIGNVTRMAVAARLAGQGQ